MFLGIVTSAPPAVYRLLARKIAISTTIFLLTIDAIGTVLLRFFGISVPVMEVAGGFPLVEMGWNLLNQSESEKNKKKTKAACADPREL